MPLARIGHKLFHPLTAEDDTGLVDLSPDLSVEMLLTAYRFGIYPVQELNMPILWWSPDPRWILNPLEVKVSKSMRSVLRNATWTLTVDTDFAGVIMGCATPRNPENTGQWIDHRIIETYTELFDRGLAHSFEVWEEGALIGGFYGVVTGHIFAGESMFARRSNASKYAFIQACHFFTSIGIRCVDCQQHSVHLESLGAYPVSRYDYLQYIKANGFEVAELTGSWTERFIQWQKDQ